MNFSASELRQEAILRAGKMSMITRNKKIMLSPAYDLLNTSIAIGNPSEEMDLPLDGKKNHLSKNDFFKYLAIERLQLNQNIINGVITDFRHQIPYWQILIKNSFLSSTMQKKYLTLLKSRCDQTLSI